MAGVRKVARRRLGRLQPAGDRRTRPADDQLHERHDVAAQGRDDHAPQRLHERRRHAGPPADDAGRSLPVDAADVPRQRLDVRLDRHRGRRRRTSACARSSRAQVFELDRAASAITMLCAAPTVLIGIANAPAELRARRAARRARADRRRAAGRRDDRARSRASSAGTITQVYGLTETAPFITVCEPRPEHDALLAERARDDQGAPGRRADHLRRAARRRRGRRRGAARRRRRSARSSCAATW